MSNTYKREIVAEKFTSIENKIRLYVITGVCNNHHKNNGKRQKICLVRENIT